MAAVTICSDFGAPQIKSVTVSTVSPSICHEVMGLDAVILVFWTLGFKPAFPLSSLTFIQRLSSVYPRFLCPLLPLLLSWWCLLCRAGGWPLLATWYPPPCFSASPPLSSGVRASEARGTGPHLSGTQPLWGWGVHPHTMVTQTVLEGTQWGLYFAARVTAEQVTSPQTLAFSSARRGFADL